MDAKAAQGARFHLLKQMGVRFFLFLYIFNGFNFCDMQN